MPDIKTLGAKVGELGLGHLLVAGLSAVASDKLQGSNLFGMGQLVTGAIKVGEGIGITAFSKNNYIKAVAVGVGVTGIMDIANNFLTPAQTQGSNLVI